MPHPAQITMPILASTLIPPSLAQRSRKPDQAQIPQKERRVQRIRSEGDPASRAGLGDGSGKEKVRIMPKRKARIGTGCVRVDEVLGGGFEVGRITAVSGGGGSGRGMVCLFHPHPGPSISIYPFLSFFLGPFDVVMFRTEIYVKVCMYIVCYCAVWSFVTCLRRDCGVAPRVSMWLSFLFMLSYLLLVFERSALYLSRRGLHGSQDALA